MLLCGRKFLGARFCLVFLPLSGGTRVALRRFAPLKNSSRRTLSFPSFYVVPRALGEFDGVIWSQRFQFRSLDFL